MKVKIFPAANKHNLLVVTFHDGVACCQELDASHTLSALLSTYPDTRQEVLPHLLTKPT
jgi:hypothetical protein